MTRRRSAPPLMPVVYRNDRSNRRAYLEAIGARTGVRAKRARARGKPVARKPGTASRHDTPELVEALRIIWMASNHLCSKRLNPALRRRFRGYTPCFKLAEMKSSRSPSSMA